MAFRSLFNGIKNMWLGSEQVFNDVYLPGIINGTSFDLNKAESVSTVYICVKTLADTLSRFPLNIYLETEKGRVVDKNDYRYPILHYNPNNWTSQQTFFASCEYWRNLKGNAFARIYRDVNGRVKSLELIPPSRVVDYFITRGELYYTILDKKDKEIRVNADDILHFRGLTKDGIWIDNGNYRRNRSTYPDRTRCITA